MNDPADLEDIVTRTYLEQARETFEIRRAHDRHWRRVRLIIAYTSVLMIIAIMILCTYVILNYRHFPAVVLNAAIAAYFVDILGVLILTWKLVFRFDSSVPAVEPVIKGYQG